MRQDPSGDDADSERLRGETVKVHDIFRNQRLGDRLIINRKLSHPDDVKAREFCRHLKIVEALKGKPILQFARLLLDGIELVGSCFCAGRRNFQSLVRKRPRSTQEHPDKQSNQKKKADADSKGGVISHLSSTFPVLCREHASSFVDLSYGIGIQPDGLEIIRAGQVECSLRLKFGSKRLVFGGDEESSLDERVGVVVPSRTATNQNLAGGFRVHVAIALCARRAERVLSTASARSLSSRFKTC